MQLAKGFAQRPPCADAGSLVADCQSRARQFAFACPMNMPKLIRWAERAVALNPGEAESSCLARPMCCPTPDAPPRHWSSLSMRGGSTRCIRRFGTSISAARCFHLGRYRGSIGLVGDFLALGAHRISPSDTRAYTRPPRWRNWAGWRKRVRHCQGRRGRRGTRQSANSSGGLLFASIERDQLIEGLRKAGFPE